MLVLGGEAYTYTCPICEIPIQRDATPGVIATLARAHARATHHATSEARRGAA